MVRSIVGTLVDVGLGKASPGDVRGILVARDREAAGQVAPPYGLTLWEVGYPCDCTRRNRPWRSILERTIGRDHRPRARPSIVDPTRSSSAAAQATPSGGHGRPSSTPCAAASGAFTADELAADVPDVHVSTVYRTLALLEEIGAVRHVHLSHGPAIYESAATDEVRHLVCEVCDRHVAVPSDGVRRPAQAPRRRLRLRARRLALRHRRPLPRPALTADPVTRANAAATSATPTVADELDLRLGRI